MAKSPQQVSIHVPQAFAPLSHHLQTTYIYNFWSQFKLPKVARQIFSKFFIHSITPSQNYI